MEDNSVVSAVPDIWRKMIKDQSVYFKDKNVDKLNCSYICRFLISKIKKPPTAANKWAEVCNISEHE